MNSRDQYPSVTFDTDIKPSSYVARQSKSPRRLSIKNAISSLLRTHQSRHSTHESGTDSLRLRKTNSNPSGNSARRNTTEFQQPLSKFFDSTTPRRHSLTSVPARSGSISSASNRNSLYGSIDSEVVEDASDGGYIDSVTTKPTRDSFGAEFLSEYLLERGFLTPKVLLSKNDVTVSVATTGKCVFLPTVSTTDDEYLARLHGLREGEFDDQSDYLLERIDSNEAEEPPPPQQDAAIDGILNTNDNYLIDDTSISNDSSNDHNSLVAEDTQEYRTELQQTNTVNSTQRTEASATCFSFEMDDSMTSHSVALILTLERPTKMTNVEAELYSRVRVYWHEGVPPTKSFKEEVYNAGSLKWTLDLSTYNLYVPTNVTSKEKIIQNNKNPRATRLFTAKDEEERPYLDKNGTKKELLGRLSSTVSHVMPPGTYVFVLPFVFGNHVPESLYLPSARVSYKFSVAMKCLDVLHSSSVPDITATADTISTNSSSTSNTKSNVISPIATSSSINGLENERKKTGANLLKKVRSHLLPQSHSNKDEQEDRAAIFAEHSLNIVRTPPQISISTANKSIYIDRVWSDSLAYEICFGQKYVPLNSEMPFEIKLSPLVKNITVKRIRVSVIEKITFVSKNYEYECDQTDMVGKDPYNPYYVEFSSKRRKERNLSLLEVRTKERGCRAIKEEIVDNCYNDNLLCYNTYNKNSDKQGKSNKSTDEDAVGITEQVRIRSTLRFPRYAELDPKTARTIPPYGIDLFKPVVKPESSSMESAQSHRGGVIGFLANRRNSISSRYSETSSSNAAARRRNSSFGNEDHETKIMTHSDTPVKHHTKTNEPRRGLYLDSLNFSNINCRHKLEVMMRISKPDPVDSTRTKNYEVLVDIPIFIVSELCNSGNMELPTYHKAAQEHRIPMEVMMQLPPSFEEAVSVPASPIQSPIGTVNFPDELDIQQTSNRSSVNNNSNIAALHRSSVADAAVVAPPMHRYSNLDGLLSTEGQEQHGRHSNAPIFKPGFSLTGQQQDSSSSPAAAAPDDNDNNLSSSEDETFLLQRTVFAEPPSYDEVVPLMSDED